VNTRPKPKKQNRKPEITNPTLETKNQKPEARKPQKPKLEIEVTTPKKT
jgi:hypothetical protein